MNTKIKEAKYKGELGLVGNKIDCYVLEDGERFLSGKEMQDALKIVEKESRKKRGPRLKYFLAQKSLEPFLYKGKERSHFEPNTFYYKGVKINGYKATLLPDICLGMLEARRNIRLLPRQSIVANQCEILLGAFAKVGIIALVDEATGYQYERERFELNRIFKLLILEDGIFSEVKRMFPLGFYRDLFGVYDVDFTAKNIRKSPRFIGFLTNELIYKNLPEGSFILAKIKARTPKTKGGYPKY